MSAIIDNSQRIQHRIPKEFPKNSLRVPKEFPKNSQKIPKKFPKNSQDFENIQFPTSHLEAENPFGLVYVVFLQEKILDLNFCIVVSSLLKSLEVNL
jgi:hypothetical protein